MTVLFSVQVLIGKKPYEFPAFCSQLFESLIQALPIELFELAPHKAACLHNSLILKLRHGILPSSQPACGYWSSGCRNVVCQTPGRMSTARRLSSASQLTLSASDLSRIDL